jgi:hypothetical protein
MELLQFFALIAYGCAAVLAALSQSWPLALTAAGLALALASTTSLLT